MDFPTMEPMDMMAVPAMSPVVTRRKLLLLRLKMACVIPSTWEGSKIKTEIHRSMVTQLNKKSGADK